jgi:membrane associated rhomboid family serine protease
MKQVIVARRGLLWLGGIVERKLGSSAFAAIVAAGATASGAAGMLLGLLMCFIVLTGISFTPGVSLAGHLGGFAGGALMASMFM